jgi:hypothetical protein
LGRAIAGGGATRSRGLAMSLLEAARPQFPNERRDLSSELARIAVFIIAIGPGPEADQRPEADKTVAGCESGACLIQTREIL